MNKKSNPEKPSHEAKALSLFLMAYKTFDPIYKEQSKRINRLWDLVKSDELSREEYEFEVKKMMKPYGGYHKIVEKTVRYYVEKTGEWKLQGDDQYCQDANLIATKIAGK